MKTTMLSDIEKVLDSIGEIVDATEDSKIQRRMGWDILRHRDA